jgi:hypothetical protein
VAAPVPPLGTGSLRFEPHDGFDLTELCKPLHERVPALAQRLRHVGGGPASGQRWIISKRLDVGDEGEQLDPLLLHPSWFVTRTSMQSASMPSSGRAWAAGAQRAVGLHLEDGGDRRQREALHRHGHEHDEQQ